MYPDCLYLQCDDDRLVISPVIESSVLRLFMLEAWISFSSSVVASELPWISTPSIEPGSTGFIVFDCESDRLYSISRGGDHKMNGKPLPFVQDIRLEQ